MNKMKNLKLSKYTKLKNLKLNKYIKLTNLKLNEFLSNNFNSKYLKKH